MKIIRYEQTQGKSLGFYALVAGLGAFILAALSSVYFMEHSGHYITGMSIALFGACLTYLLYF